MKYRFVRDNNYPIQTIESPYFEYYLDLYEPTLGTKTAWESFQREVRKMGASDWLKYVEGIRKGIIAEIFKSYQVPSGLGDHEKIKGDSYPPGHQFLSVRLEEAEFQALRWINPDLVQGKKTWENYLKIYTDSPYLLSSDSFRQYILGRIMGIVRVQRHLMWKISELISPDVFSRTADEVVWEIPDDFTSDGEDLEGLIWEKTGLRVKASVFTTRILTRYTHTGKEVTGIIKDFADGTSILEGVPDIWYSQMYKAWKGLNLDLTYDLVFTHLGELARFDYPLTIINPNDKAKNNPDSL